LALLCTVACACVFLWCGSERGHREIHHSLALSGIAHDGATIGVVAHDLRRERLPITRDEFQQRYETNFLIRWVVSTNAAGDLLFTQRNHVAFTLDTKRGTVGLLWFNRATASDAMQIFKGFDFSRPICETNCPRAATEVSNELYCASDMIWETYPGFRSR